MSYSDAVGHRSMIFDGIRNAAYTRALKKVITSETTVMDLGAGLGIHGMIAARLGAAKAYLVEPTDVIEVARKIATDNKLDAVECIRAKVEELELDIKVDVLVSVFTGNFLLTEDLLPSLFYARDHYLAPGGRLIPDCGRMEVVPVTASQCYEKYVASWEVFPETCKEQGLPALDYSAMRSYAANSIICDSADQLQTQHLARPVSLMELDFNTATKAECDTEVEVIIQRDGICHGWLGWFQMRLADEWLSTLGESNETHWRPVFMPLEKPLQVKTGEKLRFALKRPEFGEWTWITGHAEKSQRQSTFLSRPLSQNRMLKLSENYQPSLDDKGTAVQWLLAQMNGELPVSELVAQMQDRFPVLFPTRTLALKFVQDLAERYS
jgi:16S rRNA G527 N7-methylase RsmG